MNVCVSTTVRSLNIMFLFFPSGKTSTAHGGSFFNTTSTPGNALRKGISFSVNKYFQVIIIFRLLFGIRVPRRFFDDEDEAYDDDFILAPQNKNPRKTGLATFNCLIR